MINFEEALRIVLETAQPLPTKTLPLNMLNGKVLAETIRTPFPLPRFDNSSVDGYAVRSEEYCNASAETPFSLKIQHTIRAGGDALDSLMPFHAIRIMTGAPIPTGADAVVMREEVEKDDGIFVSKPVSPGANIRFRGEELPEGAVVLTSGTLITPPVIGMLTTLGLQSASVYGTPRMTFIVTGDELKMPGEVLTPGQIYDSNGPALYAAASAIGIEEIRVHYVIDNRQQLKDIVEKALVDSDIVVTLGGISVGDYDYVREVNRELGIQERFWRVAMKPGKPTYFGNHKSEDSSKLVFGLPGNPVAALVTFALLVKPAIQIMMGYANPQLPRLQARLNKRLSKKVERLEFVRGYVVENGGVREVVPVSKQESHMLSGLTAANCLIIFPRKESNIEQDATVEIIPLQWNQ